MKHIFLVEVSDDITSDVEVLTQDVRDCLNTWMNCHSVVYMGAEGSLVVRFVDCERGKPLDVDLDDDGA